MQFSSPLITGTFIKRYKRFLADVILSTGEVVTAHTPNTGSMKTCVGEGWPVLLSKSPNPERKLPYTLEMLHNGKTWIGVNTSLPNHLAQEAILNGTIVELQDYEIIRPEYKWGQSRIDLYLEGPGKKCLVEIKNVTMLGEKGQAIFPDAVSERGLKHLNELIEFKKQGHRACMLYIIQREDVDSFAPAKDIDPKYSETLQMAHRQDVEILVYQCLVRPEEIRLSHSLPYIL